MLAPHQSKYMAVCASLFLVVVLGASCGPAATPVTIPTAIPTVAEPVANRSEGVSAQGTKILEKEVAGAQRIEELSRLPAGQAEHVEVVYFHLTRRCEGCIEAERLTRKALDKYFANRLESGEISLVVADIQDPQNAALVQKYDAYGPSLYLGIRKGGTEYIWPFFDIWLTSGDEAKTILSLRDNIGIALGLED